MLISSSSTSRRCDDRTSSRSRPRCGRCLRHACPSKSASRRKSWRMKRGRSTSCRATRSRGRRRRAQRPRPWRRSSRCIRSRAEEGVGREVRAARQAGQVAAARGLSDLGWICCCNCNRSVASVSARRWRLGRYPAGRRFVGWRRAVVTTVLLGSGGHVATTLTAPRPGAILSYHRGSSKRPRTMGRSYRCFANF